MQDETSNEKGGDESEYLPFSESFSALIMSIRELSSECMSNVLVRSCKKTEFH